MPTLVYTTTVGRNPNIVELPTAQSGQQALIRELTSDDILDVTPSDGLREWTLAAPLVLTALPAGHRPGFYMLSVSMYMRVAAATGNVNGIVLAWDEPGVGPATNVFGALGVTTTGLILSGTRNVLSTGLAPLTVTITPAAITGAPRANVIAAAPYLAEPLP